MRKKPNPVMHIRVDKLVFKQAQAALETAMGEPVNNHSVTVNASLDFTAQNIVATEADMRAAVLAVVNRHLRHFVLEGQVAALHAAGVEGVKVWRDTASGLDTVIWERDGAHQGMPLQNKFVYGPDDDPLAARHEYSFQTLPLDSEPN